MEAVASEVVEEKKLVTKLKEESSEASKISAEKVQQNRIQVTQFHLCYWFRCNCSRKRKKLLPVKWPPLRKLLKQKGILSKPQSKCLQSRMQLGLLFRKEKSAVAEALRAEKEAKAEINSEIERLKEQLEKTEGDLSEERRLTKNVGLKTQEIEAKLKTVENTSATLMEKNVELQSSLEDKTAQVEEISNQRSETEASLSLLEDKFGKQKDELDKVIPRVLKL